MVRLIVLFAAISLALGCDEKPASTEKVDTTAPVAENQKIHIESIKANASQTTLRTPGTTKPKEVEEMITKALYAQDLFDADGDIKARVSITYDVRSIPTRDDKTVLDAVLFGDVDLQNEATTRYKAEVRSGTEDESADVQELIDKAVKAFALEINAQAHVENATPEELVEMISKNDTPAARLIAVQEVRERRVREAIPALRKILEEDSVSLKVAASAALVAVGDGESYSAIIKFTEERSRERDPQMMALVFLIGQMQTDESKTYLEALANGHDAPPVREAAKKALETARQGQ